MNYRFNVTTCDVVVTEINGLKKMAKTCSNYYFKIDKISSLNHDSEKSNMKEIWNILDLFTSQSNKLNLHVKQLRVLLVECVDLYNL